MKSTVVIDVFDTNKPDYDDDYAVVAIDVIRATTTAVTGVALGRQCFPVSSVEEATRLAKRMKDPLMVGELGGNMPFGFDMQNSPALLELRTDIDRPMILLSTSGTRLVTEFRDQDELYLACLRNFSAVIDHFAARPSKVALVGAGTRGEFREEDQLCCAWIAKGLIEHGYEPENEMTLRVVERWSGAPVDVISSGNSAAYLQRSGQTRDLEFILTHVDDLKCVYQCKKGQVFEQAPDSNEAYSPDEIQSGIIAGV